MKIVKLLFLTSILMFTVNSASAQLEWVPFKGEIPRNAVIGGVETHRSLPVCRCEYKGAKHPGKVVANKCNIGWGGREMMVKRFEVLVNKGIVDLEWLKSDGAFPENAIVAGKENGQPLYVGRAHHEKGTHPGKVFKVGKEYICNFGYGGKEITHRKFEVLVEVHHPDKKICDKAGKHINAKSIKTLSKERRVNEGESLVSRNFVYQTRVTDDGRLVIEEIQDHIICETGNILVTKYNEIWSNTTQKGDASKKYYLKFQNDGNLCIYYGKDTFVWCSMSNAKDGQHFEITNMGHIEVVNSHGVEIWPH